MAAILLSLTGVLPKTAVNLTGESVGDSFKGEK